MPRINVIFDSQILNSIQLCAYRTDLMFNKNLQPPVKAAPLEEGDLLHRMLEFQNLVLKAFPSLPHDNTKWKKLVDAALYYGQRQSATMHLPATECEEVFFQYEKYANFNRMEGVVILEVERPFIIELYKDEDIGVYYTGKIDRLTDTPSFGICPRDYKKKGRNEEPLPLSNQFTGYACATESPYVIIDSVGFQKTLTPEDRFRWYPLQYTQHQIDIWKEDTIWWARQLAYFNEEGIWPRNRTSCDKYGKCLYHKICKAATPEAREMLMATDFIVADKWDPTEILKKDEKKETEVQSEVKEFLGSL